MATQIEYLTVYNAHTGSLLRVPKPLRFHTLGDFKNYLYEHFTNYIIGSTDNIFLLTAFGIKLNFAMINSISDIYMFDKRLFVQGNYDVIFDKYLQLAELHLNEMFRPKPYEPSTSLDDEIPKIVSTLKVCDGWSRALVQDSHQINERIDQYIRQTNAMFMSLSIIFEFTTNYIRDIKKYYENTQNHVQLLSMKSLHHAWRSHYNDLKRFPDFTIRLSPNLHLRLADFLDSTELESSAAFIAKYLPAVVEKFNNFAREVARVNKMQLEIDQSIEHLRKDSIGRFKDSENSKSAFLIEVEKLSKQIMDETQVLSSKNAREIYPRQMEKASMLYSEVENRYNLLRLLYDFKCKLGKDSISIFERMGSLQKSMVQIRSEIKSLTGDRMEEISNFKNFSTDGPVDSQTIARIQVAEDHLSLTIDFPQLFGTLMIEKRRQYEWHNFFSKGVVHNMSEQLTMIIKHERDFQKLWIRKYGRLMKFINLHNVFRIQLPSIELSLVNGQVQDREDSILSVLGDREILREDIADYIQTVNSQKLTTFAENLTKSFDSLTVSTDNLKHITKIIATLSSFVSPNNLKLRIEKEANPNASNVENDADLNIISGLRSRIRCLESLLHQRQYQELLSWPVLKSSGGRSPDNRQSMLLLAPTQSVAGNFTMDSTRPAPRRAISARPHVGDNSSSKILDASVTIDKHLDNIRLRRENSELISSNGLLVRETEGLRHQLSALRKQLDERNIEAESMRTDFEQKFAITQSTIEELGNRHEEEFQSFKKSKLEEFDEYKRTKEEEFRELRKKKDEELQELKKNREEEFQEFKQRKTEELLELKKSKDEELRELKKNKDEEIQELKKSCDDKLGKLTAENSDFRSQVANLKNSLQNNSDRDRATELDLEVSNLVAELSDLKILNSDLTSTLNIAKEQLTKEREIRQENKDEAEQKISDREQKINDLEQKLKDLEQKIYDLELRAKDLELKFKIVELESKEANLSLKSLESMITELQLKVKELSEELLKKSTDNERMIESTKKQKDKMSSLLSVLNKNLSALMVYIEQLVARNMEFVKEFCFVLESMGLLLVADNELGKHELKITRVKGLRTKRGTETLDEKTLKGRTIPHSEMYSEISDTAKWTKDLAQRVGELKEHEEDELSSEEQREQTTFAAEQLEEIFEANFENGSDISAYAKFMSTVAFTDNVQLQTQYSDVEAVNEKFFLNGISKRFLDVEGFAKKLTKENKQKAHELAKYIELCNSKITVNNFSIGDLVLFLPIRIDGASDQEDAPWTAFNIDSPNYLLDPQNKNANPNQEWVVNRVKQIAEHEVTQDTENDRQENPFALGVGSTWFMIYTT